MAEAYAMVLRERVVRAYEAGEGSGYCRAVRPRRGDREAVGVAVPVRRTTRRGGTPSRITAADVETLVTQLGDPTAGEITAAYNRTRRGRARVHVST